MRSVRDLSIRSKLALVVVSSSCLALLLSFVALVARYVETEPAKLVGHLTMLSRVVGANSAGALVFDDKDSARRTLSALAAETSVSAARIFDARGRLFATFGRTGPGPSNGSGPAAEPRPAAELEAHARAELVSGAQWLRMSQAIVLDGEQIGILELDAELEPLRMALLRDIGTIWLIILASGAVALLLSARLQKLVSGPILDLAHEMRRVSRIKDYSRRLQRKGNDEIGSLIDGFNDMLHEIQVRDRELDNRRAELENAQRIARLADWSWEASSGRLELSVMAQRLLGDGVPDNEATFEAFMARVHPQDRARVRASFQAAAARLAGFEVEHRVLLADGTVRYLRQRVEPVAGSCFAGTLQDVTNEAQAEERLRVAANALENTADSVMITDAAHRIVSVNRAFSEMTGYSADEAKGDTPRRLRSDRHDDDFYAAIWHAVEQSHSWEGELWGRRRNGEVFPQWVTISEVHDASGNLSHYVSVSNDISQYKRYEASLEFLAHNDALTGLPNRGMFEREVREALVRGRKHGVVLGLMFVDIDRFKMINDTLGHAMGDRLLVEAAARLKQCVRDNDLVARQGGDEFTVLLDSLRQPQDAAIVAQKIVDALARPFVFDGRELSISGSVGVSCFPQDGNDVETLFMNADAAMYRAKEEGKNGYRFHSSETRGSIHDALALTTDLRRAIERDEFIVHYQPRYDLASSDLVGLEALVRWQHPQRGLIMPGEFIALAEETGMIEAIGDKVLTAACSQVAVWQAAGLETGRVAVNLSPRQFVRRDLVERIGAVLAETGLDPHDLEIEITEGIIIRDHQRAQQLLMQLKSMGIGVAVDDFGTGYSSLAYLKRFPLDCLKIDRSFVRDTPNDADDTAITKAIIALGKSLRLRLVAEGVETPDQASFLRASGCDEAQGYYFSKPLAPVDVERLLAARSRSGMRKTQALATLFVSAATDSC